MDLGQEGERLARRYLEQQGLTFVEQNVRYSFGELDLVMKQGSQWVFVEVKYRSPSRFGGALQSLTARPRLPGFARPPASICSNTGSMPPVASIYWPLMPARCNGYRMLFSKRLTRNKFTL